MVVTSEALKLRKFASHFKDTFSCNDPIKPVELLSKTIANLKRGKAVDIGGISAEHLQFSHPCLPALLAKLIQLMIFFSYIPEGFRYNYIVPIPTMVCPY